MGKKLPLTSEMQYFTLSLELDNTLVKIGNTAQFLPYWKMTNIPVERLMKISEMAKKELEKSAKVMTETELIKKIANKGEK